MIHIYFRIDLIKDLPKRKFTTWVGTTPIGIAKRALCKYKKGEATCSHIWHMTVKDPSKSSIELILKSKKVLKGETEYGRLVLPLSWFPICAYVKETFPIINASRETKCMINVSVQLAKDEMKPFTGNRGALLAFPTWGAAGTPNIDRSMTSPTFAPTVQVVEANSPQQNQSKQQRRSIQQQQQCPQQYPPQYPNQPVPPQPQFNPNDFKSVAPIPNNNQYPAQPSQFQLPTGGPVYQQYYQQPEPNYRESQQISTPYENAPIYAPDPYGIG